MSFGFGLGAGLRALTAARMGIQTAGNNVANVNTPGYSRQRVELASSLSYMTARGMQIGTGVDVVGITRLVDEGLDRRIRLQLGLVGAAEVEHSRWQELEGLFSEPNGGLGEGLSGLFGSIGRLQTDPGDRALRGGVVQAGNGIADQFRLMSRRFDNVEQSTFTEVRGLLRQVNERAAAVASLNGQIAALEANGSTANDLRDQREQHIKEMSRLIDTQAMPRATGTVDLLVGGHLLVAGDRVSSLSVTKDDAGQSQLVVGASSQPIQIHEGRIAALLRQESAGIPGLRGRVDALARNLILEVNRIQTTGMPRSGPFASLTSYYGAADGDGDGTRGDELLGQSGFQFPIQPGELHVAVTNRTTGTMERQRIAIDPRTMTLQDLASALDAIDHLSASVDPSGRLRVSADQGYGFDFSTRLDPQPNSRGTLGGRNPSLGSGAAGPFDLSAQTFPVSLQVTTGSATSPIATTVTLDATDFANPGAATVDELVAAMNADLGGAATAMNVGGRLVIRSGGGGSQAQLSIANVGPGTARQALGLPATTAMGQEQGVAVRLEGAYQGTANDQLVFVPGGDGEIGVTPGLQMSVYDRAGNLVTRLDVGPGYTPGDLLELGNGIKVGFGSGAVSASAGHAMAMDVLADSDTSDVLVALGMNSFFHGSSAADIAINDRLLTNPDLLAAGLTAASGDGGNLARLMQLQQTRLDDLDGSSLEDFNADLVGELGFSAAGAEQLLRGQDQLLAHLEQQRESVAGVNLDEEMVSLMQFQTAFDAAARFLSTVQDLTQTLMSIGR